MLKIEKKPGVDFKILNFSDPQLGNEEWVPEHHCRKILVDTVTELMNRVKPDLVTVSGDLSWSGNTDAYMALADLLDTFGVPWAPVWGNHDNQGGPEFIEKTVDEYLKHPLCMYEKGSPEFGNGNYIIGITENGKPVHAVIMFDSHDRTPFTNDKGETSDDWAKLYPEQIEMYSEWVENLKKEGYPESSLIMHIPIYGYREAFEAAFNKEYKPDAVKSEESSDGKYWNEGYKNSFGVKYEGICSYSADEGALDAILKGNHTKTLVAGHDHVNNFVIEYKGIKFVYSLKAGAGCYWNPILNGGTVLNVRSDGSVTVNHEYVKVN